MQQIVAHAGDLPGAGEMTFVFSDLKRTEDGDRQKLCETSQCRAITPMRGLAVKSPAVSEIDMHTSIVAAEAGPPAQEPGPRRRLPLVQIIQERSRP